MIWNFIKPITDSVGSVAKIFVGDKSKRDEYSSNENIAGLNQFASEFNQRENRTWWDSLVDGINRLMRPSAFFTFIGMFWLAVYDPTYFALIVVSLKQIPELFWYTLLAMIGFLFPSRIIEKGSVGKWLSSIKNQDISKTINAAKEIEKVRKEHEDVDTNKMRNETIDNWLKNRSK